MSVLKKKIEEFKKKRFKQSQFLKLTPLRALFNLLMNSTKLISAQVRDCAKNVNILQFFNKVSISKDRKNMYSKLDRHSLYFIEK